MSSMLHTKDINSHSKTQVEGKTHSTQVWKLR